VLREQKVSERHQEVVTVATEVRVDVEETVEEETVADKAVVTVVARAVETVADKEEDQELNNIQSIELTAIITVDHVTAEENEIQKTT
jgi:hypothetical protein